jgi:hypothetical protein
MKQVPNRKKLRREYLRTLFRAFGIAVMCGFLAVAGGLILFIGVSNSVLDLLWFVGSVVFGRKLPEQRVLSNLFFDGTVLPAIGFASRSFLRGAKCATQQVHNLSYVLPIITDTLPADEILVRASVEPPVVQSEVLLRAATGTETPKEELLRVAKE